LDDGRTLGSAECNQSNAMKLHPVLPAALLGFGFAGSTRADLLFSSLLQPGNGAAPFAAADDLFANDFLTDGTPRSITSLTVSMENTGELSSQTVSFSIYTDNGSGVPDALLSAFDTSVLLPPNSSGSFTATSLGINLQANTTYWVVGQLIPPDSLGTVYWLYSPLQGTDGGPYTTVPTTPIQGFSGGSWSSVNDGNLKFALEGTAIPEASALPVVVIGGTFAAFGCWIRRRVAGTGLPDRGFTS
jgi:hypothetical protein